MPFSFSFSKAPSDKKSDAPSDTPKPATASGKSLGAMAKLTKNWQEALNPKNGFSRIAGKPGGLSIMAKIEKNWQTAKKSENGFRQIYGPKKTTPPRLQEIEMQPLGGAHAKQRADSFDSGQASPSKAKGLRIMAKIEKNWETAKNPENGFRQILGPKKTAAPRSEEIEMQEMGSVQARQSPGGQRKNGQEEFTALAAHSASSRRRSAHGSLDSASESSEE